MLVSLLLGTLLGSSASAQTTLLFEGFENPETVIYGTATNEPTTTEWVIYDPFDPDLIPTNAWGVVNKAFGNEGTRLGNNKLYCAGRGWQGIPGSTAAGPMYADGDGAATDYTDMARVIDLTDCVDASLSFWFKVKIPDIEFTDYMTVYIDDEVVFETDIDVSQPVPEWTQKFVSLKPYCGSTHILRFEFQFDESNSYGDPAFDEPTKADFEGIYVDDILIAGVKNNYLPDFNLDGQTDIVFQNTNSASALYGKIATWYIDLNNPTNALKQSVYLRGGKPVGAGWLTSGYVDLDLNGYTDILFQHSSGTFAGWYMTNSGTTNAGIVAKASTLLTAGLGWRMASVDDFNNDGKRDWIWQRASDGYMALWYMNGTNRLANGVKSLVNGSSPGKGVLLVGTADFNFDGQKDLLMQKSDGTINIWLMNGINLLYTNAVSKFAVHIDTNNPALAMPSGVPALKFSKDWKVVQLTDFNGDGQTDFLMQHTDGSVAVWYIDSTMAFNVQGARFINKAGAGWLVCGPR